MSPLLKGDTGGLLCSLFPSPFPSANRALCKYNLPPIGEQSITKSGRRYIKYLMEALTKEVVYGSKTR